MKVFRYLDVLVTGDNAARKDSAAQDRRVAPAPRLSSSFDVREKPPPALLARVRSEFLEMPGLRLTTAQAARLWAVDHSIACALLQALAETRFLMHLPDGSFARWSD